MMAVLIEFRVRPGQDDAFRAAWTETTDYIRVHFGSLGSRLHRAGDHRYVAYALWPDRETYDRDHAWSESGRAIRQRMADTLIDGRGTVLDHLDVVVDRLAPIERGEHAH
ncbi:antibiotic biosynthesis monooxygenase [Halomonas denitrificans]|nr:antibiotic biosynthesis monooxygenase [Halomonas denitrificans]